MKVGQCKVVLIINSFRLEMSIMTEKFVIEENQKSLLDPIRFTGDVKPSFEKLLI